MTPEETSGRLPRLTPDQLDIEQKALYDNITGGERAHGVQHFPLMDDSGALNGPFGAMLHAPVLGMPLQAVGAALRFHTDLTPRIREISILHVAQAVDSSFEWWAHERVGRAAGLTNTEIDSVRSGTFHSGDPFEAAAATLCTQLLQSIDLTDDEFTAAVGALGTRRVVEITTLVGYYRTLAQLMDVFHIGLPSSDQS
ncbi:carboxymuconolactone decarboxylase family protein [Rhodococcus ruber]|uniref:Carboxymuconolactone decarboxylase family protein n=1 Tax=Rhodococcus ruber TaxID=1830 RepID=A0ABT4ML83_9NOCA|nr:carboxymuconolactone decarboxylase family protein [Rhodococcus ruber]MCZ4521753.1 carboxymuconolactone decarboxylase family protein [Rhodococcus ruber]